MYRKQETYGKKFPAVMVKNDILGIEEGTILRYDPFSSKYVSVCEEEEIADGYYYSGTAISIDPFIVQDNLLMGENFVLFEDNTPELPVEETIAHVVTKEDLSLNPGEDLKEGEEIDIPKNAIEDKQKTHTLVVDCACGHRHIIQQVNAPGINITLMAEDESSFVELYCTECESKIKLWFAPSNEYIGDEPTKEESI